MSWWDGDDGARGLGDDDRWLSGLHNGRDGGDRWGRLLGHGGDGAEDRGGGNGGVGLNDGDGGLDGLGRDVGQGADGGVDRGVAGCGGGHRARGGVGGGLDNGGWLVDWDGLVNWASDGDILWLGHGDGGARVSQGGRLAAVGGDHSGRCGGGGGRVDWCSRDGAGDGNISGG